MSFVLVHDSARDCMHVCLCVCVLLCLYVWLWCVLSSAIPLCPNKFSAYLSLLRVEHLFWILVLFCTKSSCKCVNRCTSEPKEQNGDIHSPVKWSEVVWQWRQDTQKNPLSNSHDSDKTDFTTQKTDFFVFFVCTNESAASNECSINDCNCSVRAGIRFYC